MMLFCQFNVNGSGEPVYTMDAAGRVDAWEWADVFTTPARPSRAVTPP
jgi:hypothetical protein